MALVSDLDRNQRDELRHLLTLLMEANEPEALLASLRRIAERKAFGVTAGRLGLHDAERWQRLTDVMTEAEQKLARKNIDSQD